MVKYSDVLIGKNGTMVLDDNSTSGGIIGSHLVWFSNVEGEEEFCDEEDLTKLEDGSIKFGLSVKNLLECWLEKYGEEEFDPSITHSSGLMGEKCLEPYDNGYREWCNENL
jgi:hypothetical protein